MTSALAPSMKVRRQTGASKGDERERDNQGRWEGTETLSGKFVWRCYRRVSAWLAVVSPGSKKSIDVMTRKRAKSYLDEPWRVLGQ